MAAAVKGRRDAAAFLIDAGADIEALAEKDGITEKFDDTSLLSQISDARYAGVDHSAIRDCLSSPHREYHRRRRNR